MGQENLFKYLGHYLPPIPATFTAIKILKLCTILLCSTQHFLIQNKNATHKKNVVFCHSCKRIFGHFRKLWKFPRWVSQPASPCFVTGGGGNSTWLKNEKCLKWPKNDPGWISPWWVTQPLTKFTQTSHTQTDGDYTEYVVMTLQDHTLKNWKITFWLLTNKKPPTK